jgi:uncharacterized protein CbrC (UPF0167 family)
MLSEYNKGFALWKTMPATMIRKVAIVQALREAFPETLSGMYSEDEIIDSNICPKNISDGADSEKLNKLNAALSEQSPEKKSAKPHEYQDNFYELPEEQVNLPFTDENQEDNA